MTNYYLIHLSCLKLVKSQTNYFNRYKCKVMRIYDYIIRDKRDKVLWRKAVSAEHLWKWNQVQEKINFLLVRAELFMRGSLCYVNSPLAFDKYTDWGAAMQLKKAISSVAFIFSMVIKSLDECKEKIFCFAYLNFGRNYKWDQDESKTEQPFSEKSPLICRQRLKQYFFEQMIGAIGISKSWNTATIWELFSDYRIDYHDYHIYT